MLWVVLIGALVASAIWFFRRSSGQGGGTGGQLADASYLDSSDASDGGGSDGGSD